MRNCIRETALLTSAVEQSQKSLGLLKQLRLKQYIKLEFEILILTQI